MAGEKGALFSNQLLGLIFNATAIPNLAINATSAPLTSLYGSLHTGDPTASGNQTTNEVAYTGYARFATARTAGGWVVSGQTVDPAANLIWPSPTGAAGQIATFWGIGTSPTGTGTLLYAAPISPSITITLGLPPTLTTASSITEA